MQYRWNAVCGESRTHGVEQGKIQRLFQRITYCYNKRLLNAPSGVRCVENFLAVIT